MGNLDATNYSKYNQKVSASNTTNSTDNGLNRFTRVVNGILYTTEDLAALGLTGGFTDLNLQLLEAEKGNLQPKPGSNDVNTGSKNNWMVSPLNYKFNLPPHQWSIPLRPQKVDANIVSGANNSISDFHGLRRGRIWYWNTSGDITQINESGNVVTARDTVSGTSVVGGNELNLEDRKYAFQFLWNPETITSTVTRNMDITPSAADSLRVVTGVFPGQEAVSLNIVLDRTNDFACIKHTSRAGGATNLNVYETFYKNRYPKELPQDFSVELDKLMRLGTLYDLEYLFRAVNGSGFIGPDGKPGFYTNLLNRTTANIGYLQPTLLGIELGPTIDSLSYVGWISNLSMTHTRFTETMIPLQTTVAISIECFSGSGIGASK
jgi:hypothetical protein